MVRQLSQPPAPEPVRTSRISQVSVPAPFGRAIALTVPNWD